MTPVRKIADFLLDLVYPRVCEVCGRSLLGDEDVMCLHCLYGLPRMNVHNDNFNSIHKRLAGSVPVERAAGYFHYYRKSPYNEIIHRAKYQGRPMLVKKLAARFARELQPSGFFDGIDLIVPVPLHRFKLIRRGYNQSMYIARGLSEVTGIPAGDNLVSVKPHPSQTLRSDFLRWLNAQSVYGVRDPHLIAGKHLLIVDDVITTGATMLACCNALRDTVAGVRISVLSLGVAHLS